MIDFVGRSMFVWHCVIRDVSAVCSCGDWAAWRRRHGGETALSCSRARTAASIGSATGWMMPKTPGRRVGNLPTACCTPKGAASTSRPANKYGDFDLRFDWKISPNGNSGVMYRVSQETDPAYYTGPEYQVIDDVGNEDAASPDTSSASLYALYAPTKTAGQAGGRVERGADRGRRQSRRALSQWREGGRVRAGERRLEQARRGEQI